MKCKQIMSHSVKTCYPKSTVKQAARIMKQQNCGVIPVVDKQKHLKGIVTDRDIALFVSFQEKSPEETYLEDFMNKDVITCHEDDSLDELVEKMRKYQIRRIPIVDKEGKMTGMVTIGDIAVKAPEEEHKVYETLEKISEPVHG